ncbi:MAG: DUF4349 domain-containing protein [Actinomycetota bacterium]|nr:DUF4349 domain-containing protein [Actinomycetota bacterium]
MAGRKWLWAAVLLVLVSVTVSAAVLGCGTKEAGSVVGDESVLSDRAGGEADKGRSQGERGLFSEGMENMSAEAASGWSAPTPPQATSSAGTSAVLEQLQLKVIKTALVKMELAKGEYGSVREDAVAAAKAAGGYVEDESSSRDGDGYTHATLTLRVPADRFDELLGEVSSLGEVTSSQVKTQDVSEEYVDLESRLRHLQAQEQFYLTLISRAQTIQEMISIREHLDSIQLEKEQVQGRMNFLDKQVGFSTLTLSVDETSSEGGGEGFWDRVGEAFKSFGRGMKKLAVGFFYALPYLLILALVTGAVWLLVRRARRSRSGEGTEAGR